MPLQAQDVSQDPTAQAKLMSVMHHISSVLRPESGRGKAIRAEFVCKEAPESMGLKGKPFVLAYQAPDRLRIEGTYENTEVKLVREGSNMAVSLPSKRYFVQGSDAVPRFPNNPSSLGKAKMDMLSLPVKDEQLALLPGLVNLKSSVSDGVDWISGQLKPEAARALKLPGDALRVRLGGYNGVPDALAMGTGEQEVLMELTDFQFDEEVNEETFQLKPGEGDKVEKVATSHLAKFMESLLASRSRGLAPLPQDVTGVRKLIASEGNGRLEEVDGTLVLFLKGTPEEMGTQHGRLMKRQIRRLVDSIVYGVGVGSSFDKGRWFFDEIAEAQSRFQKYVPERHLHEMDAIAAAAGLEKEEIRIANFFPELFHCSGFALLGKATVDGNTYHGRILDYLKGMGLEENAVVIVTQPDVGHAWVNLGYAGFVGSVTAMNSQQVAIGEMGGRGEGNWDGKPMSNLMREAMETCSSVDEVVELMKRSPRTCEYYYVVSDAKSGKACGIKAKPESLEVIWDGEAHPQLATPVEDTVLMSADQRYVELSRRAKAGFGKFDANSARELMTKPVCMGSNIQSVLFCPNTLDFWVANADKRNVASHTRYTKYNLKELLSAAPAR
jgi:hypothetical protein